MPRILLVALLVIAAVATACTGDASGVSCPETAPSPLPTPPFNDDPELAERLPSEVDGQELEVQSVCATTAQPGGLNLSPTFLEAVGVELSDVTLAVSAPREVGADASFVSALAYRYRGADEGALQTAVADTLTEAEVPHETETIAGKDVTRVIGTAVWYVAGDTLYQITAEPPQVEEVLAALP